MIGQTRTRLLGVTVLVVVFAVGGLTGAVVQRTALAANATNAGPPRPPGPSLFETLKLTDAQQKQVCTIMQRRAEQIKPYDLAMQKAWKENAEPAVRAIMAATNADMDSVLTPEQRKSAADFRAARAKYFEQRQAQDKAARQIDPKDPHRGVRSGPNNPLGVSCPGLNDDNGPHSGPGGPNPQWHGDSSHDRMKAPAQQPPMTTEHQS